MEPGTDAALRTYSVVIPYREPTYELYRGGPPIVPYRATYKVEAKSTEEAIRLAIKMFEERARASSVRWIREIDPQGIQVQLEEG